MHLVKRAKLVRLVPVGVAALLLLTGCDQSAGTAARVGHSAISTHDVDLVSRALCQERSDAASTQNDTRISLQLVHREAVGALVDATLSRQFAQQKGAFYSKDQLSQQLASIQPLIDKLPAADRDRTRTLIGRIFQGRLELSELGAQSLTLRGQRPTSQDQALSEGLKLRSAYDKKVKVVLNPRYDTDGPGKGGDGSQSLSKAVSSYAQGGQTSTQDPVWTAGLPANARCG